MKRLQDEWRELTALLDVLSVAALIATEQGRLLYVNPAGRRLIPDGTQDASGSIRIHVLVDEPTVSRAEQLRGLTRRERQVAELLAHRRSDREIAEALSISVNTARNHVSRVLGKLGVRTRRAVAGRLR